MSAVKVKLYICVETNSCNKIFEKVTNYYVFTTKDIFFTLSFVNFQLSPKLFFLGLKAVVSISWIDDVVRPS